MGERRIRGSDTKLVFFQTPVRRAYLAWNPTLSVVPAWRLGCWIDHPRFDNHLRDRCEALPGMLSQVGTIPSIVSVVCPTRRAIRLPFCAVRRA